MSNSHPNHSVSVFHFTSKVSSAKIRKYKAATERGMSAASNSQRKTASKSMSTAQRSASITSNEHPIKKHKLTLAAPDLEWNECDSITVASAQSDSQPKTRQSGRSSVASSRTKALTKPQPTLSSGLSTFNAAPSNRKRPISTTTRTQAAGNKEYGDFLSYYVAGEDGHDENQPEQSRRPSMEIPTKSKHVKKHVTPPAQLPYPSIQFATPLPRPKPNVTRLPPPQQPTRGLAKHPTMPTNLPRQRPLPMPPPPPMPAQTMFELIDVVEVANPDPVPVMIKKIDTLCVALENFSGVSTGAKPVVPEQGIESKAGAVDKFLALFDNEEESDEEQDNAKDDVLRDPGVQDGPLTHGVQFIMNALNSWAQQRLRQQQILHAQEMRAPPEANRRGPGRPRKSYNKHGPSVPAAYNQALSDVLETPEGRAIIAFRAVLQSGCLRVNADIPVILSQALSRLYLQIDSLINQDTKGRPPWRCVSYTAQINANQARVAEWRVAHQKALEEMARQQELANAQVMRQMGIPVPSPSDMFSAADIAQYHLQQHVNPMHHKSRVETTSTGGARAATPTASSLTSTMSTFNAVPQVFNEARNTSHVNGNHIRHAADSAISQDMTKMYSPGLLSRSGQSMKFSFAPTNEAAIHAFGAHAFPAINQPLSTIPNRGPMSLSAPENLVASTTSNIGAPHSQNNDERKTSIKTAAGHAHPKTHGAASARARRSGAKPSETKSHSTVFRAVNSSPTIDLGEDS